MRVCLGVAVEELQPQVVTNRGSIQSDLVVVATGAWTPLVTKLLGWQPPIRPIRGTLLALGPLPKTLHHTLTTSTFYYWQLASGFVAGGGSLDDVGFEAGVNPDTTRQIRRAMNERIPSRGRVADQVRLVGVPPTLRGPTAGDRTSPRARASLRSRGTFQEGHYDEPGDRKDSRRPDD